MVLPYTFPQKQTFGFDAQPAASWTQRTVIQATALVDAGQLQTFDRVGNLLKVLLGQVQIPGRGLQIFMVFGIEPARIEWDLSPLIQRVRPAIEEAILNELPQEALDANF